MHHSGDRGLGSVEEVLAVYRIQQTAGQSAKEKETKKGKTEEQDQKTRHTGNIGLEC